MNDYLSDKVAIVTGGATGIGRETALEVARAGARAVIVVYSRSQHAAHQTVEQLRTLGTDARDAEANIADPEQVQRLVDDVLAAFGRLHVIVNSAARTRLVPFERLDEVTTNDWHSMLDLNTIGPFNLVTAASSALQSNQGAVVNIASASAERAAGTSIPYSVSKAALLQVTRCLAVALSPDVRVNTVSPGAVDSRWMTELLGPDEARARHHIERDHTPLRRIAHPTDIAQTVVSVLQSRHITGQNIVVDGGRNILY